MLTGKKTYILAAGWVLIAVGQFLAGEATAMEAVEQAWEGGLAATFRAALAGFEAKFTR